MAALSGVWLTVLPLQSSVTSDDGAYALHVSALEADGVWSVPHVLAEVDPEGIAYPYQNAGVSDEGFFPAARHAVWIRVLAAADAVGGVAGMRFVPLLGLIVAVSSSMAIAARLHGAEGRWLAGVLAFASPLVFNSLQLWAHAAVAGLIGLSMLGMLRVTSDPSVALTVLTAAALGGASALRADGFLFASAVVAVLGLSGLRLRRPGIVASAAVCGAVTVGSFLLSDRYADSIVGSTSSAGFSASRGSGRFGGRLGAAVQTFVTGGDSAIGTILAVSALGLTAYGVLCLRRGDASPAAAVLAAATALWVVRISLEPRAEATGLLAAWPVVVLALLRPWSALGREEKRLLGVIALASLGLLATQYDEGGGLNWGGRFLAPAIPVLAVLAAAGIRHAITLVPRGSTFRWAAGVTSLVVATFAASLTFDAAGRLQHDSVIARAQDVTDVPVVTSIDPLPRLAWSTYPDVQWLRVPVEEAGGVDALIADLRSAGIERVALFGVRGEAVARIAGDSKPIDTSSPVVVNVSR